MEFELIPTRYFLGQLEPLQKADKEKIQTRLLLAKENPYRNKSIHSRRFGKLFRIRMEIENVECRIIYAVIGNKIMVAGIIDRANDYTDLEKVLAKLQQEITDGKTGVEK